LLVKKVKELLSGKDTYCPVTILENVNTPELQDLLNKLHKPSLREPGQTKESLTVRINELLEEEKEKKCVRCDNIFVLKFHCRDCYPLYSQEKTIERHKGKSFFEVIKDNAY